MSITSQKIGEKADELSKLTSLYGLMWVFCKLSWFI